MNTQKVRNYMVSGALFMAAAVVSATDYTVSKSGNWSDASIWSGGEVPATTVSDNVIFGADNITLTVDGSGKTSVGTLNFGSYNATIDIASGSTLFLREENSLGVAAGKKLTFNGDGTLELWGKGKNFVATASTLEFNTDVSIVNGQGNFRAAGISFNKGLTAVSVVVFDNGAHVDFHGNITINNQLNLHGTSSTIASVFHADSVVKLGSGEGSYGGLLLRNAKVFGTIEVNKNRETALIILGYNYGTTVFEAGSSLVQQNSGTTDSFIGNIVESGKLQIKAGVKNFDLEKDLRIRGTLQLGSSNLITIGGKKQGEASFDICSVDRTNRKFNSTTTAQFILDADNDFGKLNFYGESVLTFVANGFSSTIGGFGVVDTESQTGSVTLKITESEDFKIFIKGGKKADGTADIANIESYLDDTDVRTSNIFVDGQEAFLIYNETKGGWYVNSSAAVPEPATVAAIFGLFALGFVAYRRRR